MLGQGQVQSLKLDGLTTTIGAKFSAKLDQVSQLISFGSLFTYLAVILLEVTLAITNNTGAQITVAWPRLYDCITGVILSFKSADVQLWEFTQSGGQALWQTYYEKFGSYPDVQSDLVIANTATGTCYLKLPITFFDPDVFDGMEDSLIWAELLVNSVLEITWNSNTALFGASTTWTVSPTISVYAVPRPWRAFPTLIRHTEQALTNFNQDNLAVNGLFPLSTILMPYNTAAGQTMKSFAAADFTSVVETYDGTPIYSQANPTTMTALSKINYRQSSGDRAAQWEAGGNKRLVLNNADLFSGQKSKILFASKQPIVKFVGGGGTTVSDFRILERVIVPSGRASAKAAFAAIGLNVTDDELSPKFSMNPTSDPSILQVVPYQYSPKSAA